VPDGRIPPIGPLGHERGRPIELFTLERCLLPQIGGAAATAESYATLFFMLPSPRSGNSMPIALQRFKDAFNRLNASNLDLLEEIYSPDIVFSDPVHQLQGLTELRVYYARLYEGVISCRFAFEDEIVQDQRAVLIWTMHFEHQRFRKGEMLTLTGASHLKFDERVFYHHDYFDMGAFIYERVPILSSVIRAIKKRL
jgi:SnoaL-like domain